MTSPQNRRQIKTREGMIFYNTKVFLHDRELPHICNYPTLLTITSPLAHRLRAHVDYLASPKLEGRKPGTPGHQAAAQYILKAFQEADLELVPSLHGYRQQITTYWGPKSPSIYRWMTPEISV